MGDNQNRQGRLLDLIERIGNRLPDPATLFLLGTVVVMVLSAATFENGWTVDRQLPVVMEPVGQSDITVEWQATGETYQATSLLTREGIYWLLKNLVKNFMAFPPLGVVLVGMLGIGIAERTGLISALLKAFMMIVPARLLTPAMVFLGIMSSMTLDAGYVILPPLAAALYKAAGRSPLAGLAAVFAGVAAGFNANLFITGLDPLLAGFATKGGQVIDPDYQMNPACNWWFMIASTFVITLAGWFVTSRFVERRLANKPESEGGPVKASGVDLDSQKLKPEEIGALKVAGLVFLVVAGIALAAIWTPGAPLHTYWVPGGNQEVIAEQYVAVAGDAVPDNVVEQDAVQLVPSSAKFPRWVYTIVPLLFLIFIIPAIAFGIAIGQIKSDKDVARSLGKSMAAMAPIIVLAFFAAQFIECFKYSGLDKMLAISGGQALGKAELSPWMLITAFILLTMIFNLFIGSMSAKYAMFAPIFIPMFMMVGISPELTQSAYRIGDSVSNTITPLNPYMIIILVFMQKYVPKGGMGTLISLMLPYTVVFTVLWTVMLLIWMALGIPLGPDGPLTYVPAP
jgi:aminobenzoyl-glutamate transport protein